MLRSLTTALLLMLAASLARGASGAPDAAVSATSWSTVEETEACSARNALYCQLPAIGFSVNASTAFDSEVADDLPDSLAGRTVGEATVYVTEWAHSDWVDPTGIIIRFYEDSCPPSLAAATVCTIAWEGVRTELVDWSPPTRIVYAATVALTSPVVITTGMSFGATVLIDWGQVPPYTGLTMSAPDVINGCGEAYWDDQIHGAPRWTPLSDATAVSADLAFCLAEVGTGIEEAAPVSWGRLKSIFR